MKVLLHGDVANSVGSAVLDHGGDVLEHLPACSNVVGLRRKHAHTAHIRRLVNTFQGLLEVARRQRHDVCLCSSEHAHDGGHAARRSTCCSHGWLSAAGCNTCPRSRNTACSATQEVLCACGLWLIPSSWSRWAQRPRGGRRSSHLTIQTVCTMGDRSLNYGLPGTVTFSSHCSVLNEFALTVKRTPRSTSLAVFPLRSSSLQGITRRAQSCMLAGCRLGRKQRSSPSQTLKSKRFTSFHENSLYPHHLV